MHNFMQSIYHFLLMIGIDPLKLIRRIRGSSFYLRDRKALIAQQKSAKVVFPFGKPYPILDQRFTEGGTAKGHYFHQDLLVARRIFINQPVSHVDIGSLVNGFVAHVASFREIEVLDIRPILHKVHNITFVQADLMSKVPDSLINYCDSLSSLHAVEHFGLGRYGDPINYDGYLDGLTNMYNILKKGGKFYFSVPIGPQRIEFNAHRVFSVQYLVELFRDKYKIDFFSYVDDKGDLHENTSLENKDDVKNSFGCTFGCGIFEMTKL